MKPQTPDIIAGNIRGRMVQYNVSLEYLAAAMQMSPRTAHRRLNDPDTMTLKELSDCARVLNTTPRALMEEMA